MNNAAVKKSTLRALVKTLLEDKALGPAMINVNPVVDPSAPLVDPSNTDFVPTSSAELKAALSALVTGLSDESIPKVYDSMKDALEAAHEDDMKDTDRKVEEAIRRAVRKLIKEALPVPPPPKFFPPATPSKAPGADPETQAKIKSLLSKSDAEMSPADRINDLAAFFRSKDKKLTVPASKEKASKTFQDARLEADKAAAASKLKSPVEKFASGVGKRPVAQKPSDEELSALRSQLGALTLGAGEEKDIDGKKNIMGDKTLKDIADALAAQGEKGTSISNIKKADILGTEKLKQNIDTRIDDVALSDLTVDKIASKVQVGRIDDSHTQDIIAAAAAAENLPEGSPERRQARIDFVQSIADLMNKLLDTVFSVRDITQTDLKVRQSEDAEDYDNLEDLMSLLNQTSDLSVAKELLNNFILSIAVAASIRA